MTLNTVQTYFPLSKKIGQTDQLVQYKNKQHPFNDDE